MKKVKIIRSTLFALISALFIASCDIDAPISSTDYSVSDDLSSVIESLISEDSSNKDSSSDIESSTTIESSSQEDSSSIEESSSSIESSSVSESSSPEESSPEESSPEESSDPIVTYYKLDFIVDDEVYYTIDSDELDVITIPNDPTKENYTFDGWYWDKDVWSEPFTVSSVINKTLTSDMNVYAKFSVILSDYDMSDISFTNQEYTYDGNEHELTITGTLPEGVTVSYSNNKLTDVGELEVTASFTGDSNHNAIADMKATLTITKADYDMSSISFTDQEYTYDGNEHKLTITGTLPEGVKVSYTNNKLTDVGELKVTASFKGDSNHNAIANMTAKLVINPKVITASDIFEYEGNTITGLTEYGKTLNSLTIPESINDVAITSIGVRAFEDCISLKNIEIPNSITNIGNYAFYYCSSLTSIEIPSSVTRIGDYSFYGCSSLQYNEYNNCYYLGNEANPYLVIVSLNDETSTSYEINQNTKFIYSRAFSECTSLTNITIPDGVTVIGNAAFYNCSSLTSIEIPNSVNYISGAVFSSNCTSLEFNEYGNCNYLGNESNPYLVLFSTKDATKETYAINENTKIICNGAFKNCYNLTNISIPEGIISIGNLVFNCCTSLTTIVVNSNNKVYDSRNDCNAIIETATNTLITGCKNTNIPESIVKIGNYAFYNCNICSVTIPNSVTSIGDYAFYSCSSLNNVGMPNNITSIGDKAFYSCSSLTNIEIPNSIIDIGSDVFSECSSLVFNTYDNCNYLGNESNPYLILISTNDKLKMTYEINELTRFIYEWAFEECSSLTSILIPDSVTSIGEGAFYNCISLKEITIPDSVTSIGSYAFYNCPIEKATIPAIACSYVENSNLKEVVITSGTSIESYAFEYCSSLKEITIPSSVISIGENAFKGCPIEKATIPAIACSYINNSHLKEVIIISGNSIVNYAFRNCTSLESIDIPDSLTSIGSSAFYGCSSLNKVNIHDIANWCSISFSYCDSNPLYYAHNLYLNNELITNLVIPESVTSIGYSAFYGCSSLTSIEIPSNVTSFGYWAFSGCTSLSSIVVNSNNTVYDSRNNCNAIIETSTNTLIAGCKNTVIPSSVTSIGDSAFYNCSSLESIEIPSSVTSIGNKAFYNCSSLTSIEIPDSVTSIKDWAFYGCPIEKATIPSNACAYINNNKLKEVVITSGIVITDRAFYNCSSLISIKIPESVTSIGFCVFEGCSSLTSIEIPNSLKRISSSAFSGCSLLESIEIPNSVTSIEDSAFKNCSSLTSIIIPNSVTSISNFAFENCSSLDSIEIPSSVTSIGGYVFKGCSSLKSIEIPNSVTKLDSTFYGSTIEKATIPASACYCFKENKYIKEVIISSGTSIQKESFYNCSSLTSIIIPSSVTSIGDAAFYGCSSLVSINIPDGVTNIGINVFRDCSSLTAIEISDSIVSIDSSAFSGCTSLSNIVVNSNNTVYDSRNNCNAIIETSTNTLIVGCKDTIIPNSVTSIGNSAFSDCTSLTSIELPNSVTSIEESAFSGCSSLTTINYYGTQEQWNEITIGTGNGCLTNCNIVFNYSPD